MSCPKLFLWSRLNMNMVEIAWHIMLIMSAKGWEWWTKKKLNVPLTLSMNKMHNDVFQCWWMPLYAFYQNGFSFETFVFHSRKFLIQSAEHKLDLIAHSFPSPWDIWKFIERDQQKRCLNIWFLSRPLNRYSSNSIYREIEKLLFRVVTHQILLLMFVFG